jgi:hypothetical protein
LRKENYGSSSGLQKVSPAFSCERSDEKYLFNHLYFANSLYFYWGLVFNCAFAPVLRFSTTSSTVLVGHSFLLANSNFLVVIFVFYCGHGFWADPFFGLAYWRAMLFDRQRIGDFSISEGLAPFGTSGAVTKFIKIKEFRFTRRGVRLETAVVF